MITVGRLAPTHVEQPHSQELDPVLSDAAWLPPEIFALIITDLAHDSATLKTCSLVCHAFRSLCQHYLYNLLCIRDSRRQFRQHPYPILRGQLQAFASFITTVASSVFCLNVHTLCLLGNEEQHPLQPETAKSLISDTMLASLLVHLPNVRILELSRVSFTAFAPGQHSPYPSLPLGNLKLSMLTINHVDFGDQSPHALLSVLGLFSTIDILRIGYVETPRAIPTSDKLSRVLDNLQVRRFSMKERPSTTVPSPSRTTPSVFKILFASSSVHSLQSIEIKCSLMDQVQELGRFLRKMGPQLRSVAVDVVDIVRIMNGTSS